MPAGNTGKPGTSAGIRRGSHISAGFPLSGCERVVSRYADGKNSAGVEKEALQENSQTIAAVELQLSAEVNPYLDQAIDRFDELWRARMASS